MITMDDEQREQQEQDIETLHVYPVDGGIIILKEDEAAIVEQARQRFGRAEYGAIAFGVVLLSVLLSTIALQVVLALNPPIAQVEIVAKSETIAVAFQAQGRQLAPIRIEQTATSAATGTMHQDATSAEGYITFYNGQFTPVSIAGGITFIGGDGIQIVTDQGASIPAGSPPNYGQATVAAHALQVGSAGNIGAGDINQVLQSGVLARNGAFSGGQDARDFKIVTQRDIDHVVPALRSQVQQAMQGALQGQTESGEILVAQKCSPQILANHQAGDIAQSVSVSAREQCSGITFNRQLLEEQAKVSMAKHATKDYQLAGEIMLRLSAHGSVQASGVWGYHPDVAQLKRELLGKTRAQALQILKALPVEQASIQWESNRPISTINLIIIEK